MVNKIIEAVNIKVSMDNLGAICAIDLNAPGPIGVIKKNRIVTDEEEFPRKEVEWLSGEGAEAILDVLDETYRGVRGHLAHILEEIDFEDERSVNAIRSLMAMVGESAEKMEKYLAVRGVKAEVKSEAYRALQEFYQHHFAGKIKEKHEVDETALKDMEEVRRDTEYELFYIRHEDGTPYYDLEILRGMRIICDFESGEDFEEDPLLQVRSMLDRDMAASAGQILGDCHGQISDFYKLYRRLTNNDLAISLSCACIALFMAHNPRNLLQNTTGKTSLQYFEDFHHFLRGALTTPEYQKYIAYPPEASDKTASTLLHLAHSFCYGFFHRVGGVKQEAIGLIHRTARKGQKEMKKPASLWNQFLLDDENYRTLLSKFPSGPLLKILDLIRDEEAEMIPFDPIGQNNYPMHLFTAAWKELKFDFLHLPCPTCQQFVGKVEILDEFRGMLRNSNKKKHLLFNLQDPDSWKESARCRALEAMQKNAEFNKLLYVVNLSNQGEFAQSLVPFIQTYFFGKKKTLNKREQEDFLEISQWFMILKHIDQIQPNSVSFTCKDAVDAGAAKTAAFYAFLKLLSGEFTSREEHDYFRWLMYAPALFVRERAVDPEQMNRTLAALERFDAGVQDKAFFKDMEKLFGGQILKTLEVD